MAGGVYKGLIIEIDAKTTALDAALKKSETQAKSLERELKQVEKSMRLDGGGTETAARKMELLKQSIENANDKLEKLRAAEKQIGESGMSTDQWTKLRSEIELTEESIKQYNKQMQQLSIEQGAADSTLGKMGDSLTQLGEKLDPIGEKMTSIGNKMTLGITTPIVAAATASIKSAVDIDTALTGVRKTVDGTEEDYQRLKEAAIEFSKTNAVSAEQVLNAQALGAQLGFTLDELNEFAEVATGLEIATDMGLEDAATEMAQFANITGMAHDEIENYASAIVNVGNNMATTESKVSSMAQRIAAASSQVGMTESEIIGWSGTMSSLGIEAEAGGTAFSTMVSTIDTAVATGSEDLENFAHYAGMSADEFSAAWQDSASDTMQTLLEGIASADNMTVALEELGVTGIRQTDVMKRLASNTDLVAQGLQLANEGWEDNIALSKEVDNKNDSLASKFEMLKNRVIAVAEEVGKPLADAMLEAIDAAEPLFEAIENGARAFSEMSDGEQKSVIQTVAIIAALGPALSLFGKVTSSVSVLGKALSTLATGFATIDSGTSGATQGVKKAAEESEKAATKMNKASVAMGALKGAAIALAAAGIAVLIAAIVSYFDHLEKVEKATDGLRTSMDKLGSGGSVDIFEDHKNALDGYAKKVNETVEAHAKLADEIGDLYSETESNAALADHYLQAIKDAKENYDGSAESCARLQAAVDGYNDATGSSIEITDELEGTLSTSTASLEANTEAWKANARAQAAQEAYEDLFKEHQKAIDAEAEAADAARIAWDEYNAAVARGADETVTSGLYNTAIEADKAWNTAKDTLETSEESMARAEQQMLDYTEASRIASQSTDDFRNALEWTEDGVSEFDTMAGNLGANVDTLASSMSAAGISTDKLAALGTENFEKLYRAADGDCNKIAAALQTLDEQDIDPKDVTVTDNGTIETTKGSISVLDGTKIYDKSFSVSAVDYASSTIAEVKRALDGLDDVVLKIWSGANAAGGISQSPIRKWATGGMAGIVTAPTLTSVGLVGEAGAEAIVPLTNRQYVRPFAQAVAAEMGGSQRANVSVQMNLNYDASDDAQQMLRDIERGLENYLNLEA